MVDKTVEEMKRRAGITEQEGSFQGVGVEEFMQFLNRAGSLETYPSGKGSVYFYKKGSIQPRMPGAYREMFKDEALAVYHPESPNGPFLVRK